MIQNCLRSLLDIIATVIIQSNKGIDFFFFCNLKDQPCVNEVHLDFDMNLLESMKMSKVCCYYDVVKAVLIECRK